jgi:membrane protease YdiL (CAAX protease family)
MRWFGLGIIIISVLFGLYTYGLHKLPIGAIVFFIFGLLVLILGKDYKKDNQ